VVKKTTSMREAPADPQTNPHACAGALRPEDLAAALDAYDVWAVRHSYLAHH
jgi:hypothetical protein